MKKYKMDFHKFIKMMAIAVLIGVAAIGLLGGIVGFTTEQADDEDYRTGVPAFCRRETYEQWDRGNLSVLPNANGDMGFDLRSSDISSFSLSGYEGALKRVTYNTNTVWPEELPEDFEPGIILENGRNPGLGIRELHGMGITGKGVSIAILDQGLNPEHIEYKDNLMGYELVHFFGSGAAMHGSAVTSIAVGNTCGVAPGADVYYIASTFGRITPIGFRSDVSSMADGIDRVVEINELLPTERKIRAISVSMGFGNTADGKKVQKAIERAKEAGIFVLSTSPYMNYDFTIMGLGRNFGENPDEVASYMPGLFWADDFYRNPSWPDSDKTLLVPMDSRTYASWDGVDGYEFCAEGGLSWAVPWMAGLYALCVQEYPAITPEVFIQTAFETGTKRTIVQSGKEYTLGTIVNPKALVTALEKLAD